VPGAAIWSTGPAVSWQAFDRKQIHQNIVIETERQEQAVVTYEGTVLAALREVEDDMVALAKEQARRQHLENAVEAARNAADLSLLLYSSGLHDFRDVLDAPRSLLALQELLAASQAEVTTNLIKLFKALGGGWTPAA
jgi:outer membrane protein TolC